MGMAAETRTARQKLPIWPGITPEDVTLVARNGFGDAVNAYAHSMAWFKDHLYVGTTRGNFALMRRRLPIGMDPWPVECPRNPFDLGLHSEIWRYSVERDVWKRVYRAPDIIGSQGRKIPLSFGHRSMMIHDGGLHVTTWSPAAGPGPVILRTEDGESWKQTCEPGLHGLPVTAIRTLVTFKGKVYTTPSGARGGNPNVASHSIVYESEDPRTGVWEPVSEFGFGDYPEPGRSGGGRADPDQWRRQLGSDRRRCAVDPRGLQGAAIGLDRGLRQLVRRLFLAHVRP